VLGYEYVLTVERKRTQVGSKRFADEFEHDPPKLTSRRCRTWPGQGEGDGQSSLARTPSQCWTGQDLVREFDDGIS